MSNAFWFAVIISYLISDALATPLDPVPAGQGWPVNEFVRHWESAQFDRRPLARAQQQRRARRAAQHHHRGSPNININFKAHNREFHIRLRPEPKSVFADGVEFHGTRGQLDFDTGKVYTGTLEDDESSSVYGILTENGLFDGTIWTPSEEYYIEPLSRYGSIHPSIHSIIYKKSDVIHPSRDSSVPCTSHLLHLARHDDHEDLFKYHNIQVQGINDVNNDISIKERNTHSRREKRWLPQDDIFSSSANAEDTQNDEAPKNNPDIPLDLDIPYTSHTEQPFIIRQNNTRKPKSGIENLVFKNRGILINTYNGDDAESPNNSRPKPKTHVEIIRTKSGINLSKDNVNKKPIGFTYITTVGNQSDVDLRHVNKRATIDPKKTTCMLYLQADHMFYQKYASEEASIEVMTRHVQKVNSIYRDTDFNQDGKPDNITFMIKRIKVHTMDALQDPNYRFPGNYGVEKYLEIFSEEDYDAFCLAYMFTYRDFEMGTLGLAWTGDLKNAGGVCEKNGHYRGSLKSLNTGIVTLLNYGKHVPPAVSHVTLAHEIGHNFGSPHDPEICTPGGEDGNFIMFARATSGDKKNNNKFSPCSLKSIDPVLNSKARSSKGCFTEPQISICGNGVVEPGEQCDCGWEDECRDECCHPQRRKPAPHQTPCTLTPASACSPSQGPCCSVQCTLRFGTQCRSDNGCRAAAYCDGRRASCPASIHKPNRTRCHAEFVCYMGECTGSICLAYGLESCQCLPSPGDPPTKACELCCKMPGESACRSSYQWNVAPYDVPDMFAKPGTPCNDYNGYCDVFQRCREVDPSGPLATLRNLLLSEESIASFKRWIYDHWYAVVLIVAAVIFLLVMSTRLLGKKSDPKLKSVTIIHSSTTETVRLPEHCPEGVIVHTAIRSKVPLKKKVALKSRVHRNKKNKTIDHVHKNKRSKKMDSTPLASEDPNKLTTKDVTSSKHVGNSTGRKAFIVKQKNVFSKGKMKAKKEVIDYSAAQKKNPSLSSSNHADALGKVQKWLMNSPQPTFIPKSKSTPAGLTERAQKSNMKTSPSKAAKVARTKSINSLSNNDKDKAKLQVVYKPPFKFSVKLFKNDKTKVILEKNLNSKPEHKKKKGAVKLINSGDVVRIVPNAKVSIADNSCTVSKKPSSEDTSVNLSLATDDSIIVKSASDHKVTSLLPVGAKFGHKKSNSTSQNIGDSRQNLLLQDHLVSFTKNDTHLYENMLVNLEDGNRALSKTCSMPRQNSNPHHKIIHRQSSYTHLPRAQPRMGSYSNLNNFSRHSTHGSANNISHLTMRRSSSNLNRLHSGGNHLRASFKSEQSDFLGGHNGKSNPANKRYSLDYTTGTGRNSIDKTKSNKSIHSDRAHSVQQIRRPSLNRGNLKRQLSANDMHKGASPRPDVEMPQSAGANAGDGGFQWATKSKRYSDCEVPKKANTVNNYQMVPNNLKESPGHRHSQGLSHFNSSNRRRRISIGGIKGDDNIFDDHSGRKRPKTFGEVKANLPDEVHAGVNRCEVDAYFRAEISQANQPENVQ